MADEKPSGLFPNIIYLAIQQLTAGDRIVLPATCFDKPLTIRGLRGTFEAPIVIEGRLKSKLPEPTMKEKRPISPVLQPWPLTKEVEKMTSLDNFGTVFRRYKDDKEAKRRANEAAKKREESGDYPVPAWLADQAVITLIDCQHVVVRNIAFDQCWPTAIYLESCQHIALDHLGFRGSTICIGASGRDTHDLLVQNCRWHQSSEMFGGEATWQKIHGAGDNIDSYPGVSIKNDYRHLDGDFFRAWDIFGNVVIRDNWITHCFNAVHFFTRDTDADRTAIDTLSATNVLIENNVFYKVRDNCVEPEDFAWNWVVKYNRFDDCYAPFSFEMQRFGSFYVYGNAGVLEHKVAANGESKNTSLRLWKLKGEQRIDGRNYVVHNSWRLRKRGLAKRVFGGLQHHNNAISFLKTKADLGVASGGGFFGDTGVDWHVTGTGEPPVKEFLDAWEGKCFTHRWPDFGIAVDGDVTDDGFAEFLPKDSSVPVDKKKRIYDYLGYRLGTNTVFVKEVFKQMLDKKALPSSGEISNPFQLSRAAIAQRPVEFELCMPLQFNQETAVCKKVAPAENVGAIQTDGKLFGEDWTFGFLPDFSYLDQIIREPAETMEEAGIAAV